MYTIKMDGETLYNPAAHGEKALVLAPRLSLDINAAGSLSFVLPPGNRLYNAIRRKKSVVTVQQDGVEIFRGRVLDDENTTYKEKSVYCEGTRSYLNDSLAAPYSYTGTPRGLLSKLIEEHNSQIEPEKQFVLGRVTVERADEALTCKNVAYWETFREIKEKLLDAYGGYLRARMEGGVQFLDWLKDYGRTNAQQIRFSVNLLDLKDKNDAGEVFTILRPLGASEIGADGEYSAPLTIASVNGGLDYIEDEEAVARYGRIWKTYSWAYETDPAKLLAKGLEYMKTGAELKTLTLTAIDMHFIEGSAEAIRVGDKVHILSLLHGLDLEMVCAKIDIDLQSPENTTYTFGEAPRLLTENIVTAENEIDSVTGYKSGGGRGGGGGSAQKEMSDILRWAKIHVDEANANINLNAGEIDSLAGRMSTAEIEIDGINAQILLKASQEEVTDLGLRMSAAGINIRGDIATIEMLATQKTVDAMGERVSSAELEIDGINSTITLKADKIDLQGYVTASQLKTEFSNFESGISDSLYVSHLSAGGFSCSSFSLNGYGMSLKSKSVVVSVGLSKEYASVPASNGSTYVVLSSASISTSKDDIYYYSWE